VECGIVTQSGEVSKEGEDVGDEPAISNFDKSRDIGNLGLEINISLMTSVYATCTAMPLTGDKIHDSQVSLISPTQAKIPFV
jgi:hypothetical protein